MTQTIYVNVSTGTVSTTAPQGVDIIKAEIPEGTAAIVVLPLLAQILEQAKASAVGLTPPNVAYQLVIGDA